LRVRSRPRPVRLRHLCVDCQQDIWGRIGSTASQTRRNPCQERPRLRVLITFRVFLSMVIAFYFGYAGIGALPDWIFSVGIFLMFLGGSSPSIRNRAHRPLLLSNSFDCLRPPACGEVSLHAYPPLVVYWDP